MRVIVTGAAGFIGSHLADRLLADGHQVMGLDNYSRGRPENLTRARQHRAFAFREVDLLSPTAETIFAEYKPAAVCHLAAQISVRQSVDNPVEDARQNVLGTINVLESCRKATVRRILFASSGGSIYGTPHQLPVDEDHEISPESPYAASKAACELYLRMFGQLTHIEWGSLALANVYGPRQDPHGEAGVISLFGSALLSHTPTVIYGDGSATRDFVYVEEVANAFALALMTEAPLNRRLNIGTGKQISIRDLHSEMAQLAGVADRPSFAESRPGDLLANSLNADAARDTIGWVSTLTLRQGLRRTIDWLRSSVD